MKINQLRKGFEDLSQQNFWLNVFKSDFTQVRMHEQ